MRVLVTNDDGVGSPGLWALADQLRADGHDVVVVAPSGERSGAGAAIGHIVPGEGVAVAPVERPGWEGAAWAVDGAPALCVLLAVRVQAFGARPDVVASGINPGWNTGFSVIHSGTVGAVLTASNAGLSGVAVSIAAPTSQVGEVGLLPGVPEHWATAALLAARAVALLPEAPAPTTLNLNVPNVPLDRVAGVRDAALGRFAAASIQPRSEIGPDGRLRLELGPAIAAPLPGTDNALLAEGYATVTPLVSVRAAEGPALAGPLAHALGSALGR